VVFVVGSDLKAAKKRGTVAGEGRSAVTGGGLLLLVGAGMGLAELHGTGGWLGFKSG
jgi:hypothetical protein